MKNTLKQVIDQGYAVAANLRAAESPVAAIALAYAAGQQEMRARIAGILHERRKSRRAGRYVHAEDRAIDQVIGGIPLLGGEGRSDAPEILSFEFSLPAD